MSKTGAKGVGQACGHCGTAVPAGYVTCGNCGAQYGYYDVEHGLVHPSMTAGILKSLALPVGMFVLSIIAMLIGSESTSGVSYLKAIGGIFLLASLLWLAIWVVATGTSRAMLIARGKRWWR